MIGFSAIEAGQHTGYAEKAVALSVIQIQAWDAVSGSSIAVELRHELPAS
jgi:hypothetical protein